ncbi:hypothetical protein [Arthrobacter flavus]|uniref:Uncharacterized protein n=1 Tax=Arthrobacter flavus TaxID=95172 RepID=A0ABW4Q7K9_9MICC
MIIVGASALFIIGQVVYFSQLFFERAIEDGVSEVAIAGPSNIPWDLSVGINSEVASTIVVGVGAFVFTINVAVFAARLTAPHDEASILDLARWQNRMQGLAPLACWVALAVTFTQIPQNVGLGLGLLFVSGLAISASDLRLAGRLAALKLELRVSEKFSDYADKQYENLLHALPEKLRPVDAENPPKMSTAIGNAVTPIIVAVSIGALAIVHIWHSDPFFQSIDEESLGVTGNLALLIMMWIILFITTGGAMLMMVFAMAAKIIKDAGLQPSLTGSRGIGTRSMWAQWATIPLAIILIIFFPIVFDFTLDHILLSGLIVLLCCAIQYLLIQTAMRTGRGPGMAAVWLAVADRHEDKELARTQLNAATLAHQKAVERQESLAGMGSINTWSPDAKEPTEPALNDSGRRSSPSTWMRRIILAAKNAASAE